MSRAALGFSAILSQLTIAAGPKYASDISGVFTTSLQAAGALGVAAFGALYLALATSPRPASATHAFAITTATFAATALTASAAAYKASLLPTAPRLSPERIASP